MHKPRFLTPKRFMCADLSKAALLRCFSLSSKSYLCVKVQLYVHMQLCLCTHTAVCVCTCTERKLWWCNHSLIYEWFDLTKKYDANHASPWQMASGCNAALLTCSSVDGPDSLSGVHSVVGGVVRDGVLVAFLCHPWTHFSRLMAATWRDKDS